MPKSKIISSIIALVLGLCVVVFTIAYFSINGKHNREGYTFEGDFFNGTATLIGMENPNEVVKIPQTISFLKVKKLGGEEKIGGILFSTTFEGMFEGNTTVKEIIIPNGVELVNDNAIKCCPNLEKITMPDTLTNIEIDDCDSLDKIDLPATVTNFSILRCKNLKEVNISNGNTIIEDFCFEGCDKLEDLELPKRINEISDNAFARCYSLKNIKIPDNVLSIGKFKKEIEKLKRQVVELSAEIGRSLLGESRFTPDILSTSIDNTNDVLHKKEIEFSDIKYKLANQQNAMGKFDFYYSQFRTWADEFDNSTMEQKKMIACQLIREVKIARGYEIEIVFDLNYEQFLSL